MGSDDYVFISISRAERDAITDVFYRRKLGLRQLNLLGKVVRDWDAMFADDRGLNESLVPVDCSPGRAKKR